MNALATIAAATPAPAFEEWMEQGRGLLDQRNAIEWQLADWIADGREQFGHQAEFDFLADQLGIAPKRLKSAVKVATLFPPHMRDSALTFEHHENVSNLPAPEALAVLKQAKDQHWDDRETRIHAVKRQTEISERTLLPEDDWDHHALMAIVRAWNRAERAVRESFAELMAESDLGPIDA